MIYLCDFEDSFTYNIFTELHLEGEDVVLIERKNFIAFLKNMTHNSLPATIILGPGPGHPSEYKNELEVLKSALKCEHLYFYGICLGHQLICECLGLEVERSKKPIHGERVQIKLDKKTSQAFLLESEISVQRYNSLAVRMKDDFSTKAKKLNLSFFSLDDDLMGLKGKNFLSYQFHPESVGTTFRSQYFRGLGRVES